MSTTHPDRNNGHETDAPTLSDDASHADLLATVRQLADRVSELESENERLRDELSDVRDQLSETQDELEQTRDELAETEDYVEQVAENAAVERASHASRLSELEESTDGSVEPDSPDTNPDSCADENGLHDTVRAVTPLEEAVNFPPRVAERELSENRLRGRFLARDIKQYATNVQGGWTITPSDMRTVISAYQGGGSVHPETLRRVRDFLSRWGKNEVSIREREDGTNVVVFSNEIVDRLVKITEPDHTVVTGETATVG